MINLTNPATSAPYCIALDWGTSSLRAYLMNQSGEVVDCRVSAMGILAPQDFKTTVIEACAPWDLKYGFLPCVASGMIGSQQGWQDAGYIATPATFDVLAHNAIDIASLAQRPFWITPGIKHETATALDVMRGEEIQVFGSGLQEGLAVLPGTHSKWVTVQNNQITAFQTYVTGEVFALLKTHSILSKFMPSSALPVFDAASFTLGAKQTIANPCELLTRLFSSRTMGLFQKLVPEQQPDYLSGLLIGAEVGAAVGIHPAKTVTLLGEPVLVQRYQHALQLLDIAVLTPTSATPVAATGLYRVALCCR
jgi:2-dehydro-3-deoxygalactonokinase